MKNSNILEKILQIGVKISRENDYYALLDTIISESMDIANCDAGTIYMLRDGKLYFMIMKNKTFNQSQGSHGEPINIPPVEMSMTSVCSASALMKKVINIADVYNDDSFNWNGPKRYDSLTGYHTQSMLVIPLIDKSNEVIGVLQMLNSKDDDGTVIPFSEEMQNIVFSVASEASILLSNMLMKKEISDMLDSIVETLTTAIDSRTPYNANHSRNVARLCREYTDFAVGKCLLDISDNHRAQLYMSAMLHDVGKMIIPIEVMDKATRLEGRIFYMELRYRLIKETALADKLSGKITDEEYEKTVSYIDECLECVKKANTCGFLQDDVEAKLREYATFTYDGLELITPEELTNITIKKGTLTKDERKIIEDHAVYSYNILSKMKFGKQYDNVVFYASAHHEYLDGSGYPNHLKAEDLPTEVRIMTMMDIFESLTAKDRPYKKEIPASKAYSIVCSMVNEGKLDKQIVDILGMYLKEKGEISNE